MPAIIDSILVRNILNVLRNRYNAISLEVMPKPEESCYLKLEDGKSLSLHLYVDPYFGYNTLHDRSWDKQKVELLKTIAELTSRPITMIDVGSNIGLITRQCLNQIPTIRKVFAYEPHPGNFNLLCRNVLPINKVNCINAGLSEAKGVISFFIDKENPGNYSIYSTAMYEAFEQITVDMHSAAEESKKWLQESSDSLFIYKSDTQGHDETIAGALPQEFWNRVIGGAMELWRLPGKTYDKTKFKAFLDQFTYLKLEKTGKCFSADQIIEYASGKDKEHDDLIFWKKV